MASQYNISEMNSDGMRESSQTEVEVHHEDHLRGGAETPEQDSKAVPDRKGKVVWIPRALQGYKGYKAVHEKIIKQGIPPPSDFLFAPMGPFSQMATRDYLCYWRWKTR